MKDTGIILVRPSNWVELMMEQEEASVDSPNGDKKGKELEQKMELLIRRMNMLIACVVCFCIWVCTDVWYN